MSDIDLPIYLFHQGTNYESYKFMCPQKAEMFGEEGWFFRVWAPQAKSVSVVGDFNGWQVGKNYMNKISVGVWEAFVAGAKQFDSYKFAVERQYRFEIRPLCGPHGNASEKRKQTIRNELRLDGFQMVGKEKQIQRFQISDEHLRNKRRFLAHLSRRQ